MRVGALHANWSEHLCVTLQTDGTGLWGRGLCGHAKLFKWSGYCISPINTLVGSIRVKATGLSLPEEHFMCGFTLQRFGYGHYYVINVIFARFNCNYNELFFKMLLPMRVEGGVDKPFGQQLTNSVITS